MKIVQDTLFLRGCSVILHEFTLIQHAYLPVAETAHAPLKISLVHHSPFGWFGLVYWCFTSHATIFQSYSVCDGTDVQADWKRSCTYGRAPNAIDISQGSLTCPSYTDTGPPFFTVWISKTYRYTQSYNSVSTYKCTACIDVLIIPW